MAEQTARVPLIAGNWKMNLDHMEAVDLVQKVAWGLKDAGHEQEQVEVEERRERKRWLPLRVEEETWLLLLPPL